MTNKQIEQYKNDIERELSLEVFSWMEVGGKTIRQEDTMSYWFNGGSTNIGTLYNVNSKDQVIELTKLIKEELLELSDTLVVNWDEDNNILEFYLEFTKYNKVFDRIKRGYKNV